LVSTSVPSRHPGASLYWYVIPAGAPILVQPLTLLHGLIATTPLCLHCCRNTALLWFLHLDLSVANCFAVPVVCHESRRFTLLPRHLHAPLVCRQAPGCSPATLSLPSLCDTSRELHLCSLHAPLVCRQAPGCSPATLSFSCFLSHIGVCVSSPRIFPLQSAFASAPHSVDLTTTSQAPRLAFSSPQGRHACHNRFLHPQSSISTLGFSPPLSILTP